MSASPEHSQPRWWAPGDLDGFLGLGLDNLIQILLILGLCRGVLGYPDSLLLGTVLPILIIPVFTTLPPIFTGRVFRGGTSPDSSPMISG